MRNKICPHCGSPLMKIDHYGEVLIGCVHCNYWGRPGDKRPIMEMMGDDLEALRARVRQKHPAHSWATTLAGPLTAVPC